MIKSFIWPQGRHIWSLFDQNSHETLIKSEIILQLSNLKDVIFGQEAIYAPNSNEKLSKSELGQVVLELNIAQNHSFNILETPKLYGKFIQV